MLVSLANLGLLGNLSVISRGSHSQTSSYCEIGRVTATTKFGQLYPRVWPIFSWATRPCLRASNEPSISSTEICRLHTTLPPILRTLPSEHRMRRLFDIHNAQKMSLRRFKTSCVRWEFLYSIFFGWKIWQNIKKSSSKVF